MVSWILSSVVTFGFLLLCLFRTYFKWSSLRIFHVNDTNKRLDLHLPKSYNLWFFHFNCLFKSLYSWQDLNLILNQLRRSQFYFIMNRLILEKSKVYCLDWFMGYYFKKRSWYHLEIAFFFVGWFHWIIFGILSFLAFLQSSLWYRNVWIRRIIISWNFYTLIYQNSFKYRLIRNSELIFHDYH